MTVSASVLILVLLGLVAGSPIDPVLRKLEGPRFQYAQDATGAARLADLWVTASDVRAAARYNPDTDNVYHLFTRANPRVSQPLTRNSDVVKQSNFDSAKKTIITIHGWTDNATGNFNSVVVEALLRAADVNVIVVDWSVGGGSPNYLVALLNTVPCAQAIARFLSWLIEDTGFLSSNLHLVGFSLGAQQAGIIGRSLATEVNYITALDPAGPGWYTNPDRLTPADAAYVEVIHTNAGIKGHIGLLGHVDFYPNKGTEMPGCSEDSSCNHHRAYYYFAESVTDGGFTGSRCASYQNVLTGTCDDKDVLNLGGLTAKIGKSGIYYLETNTLQPFSKY